MFINDVGQNTWEEINDGSRRRELRLARHRRADHRPALRRAALRLRARRQRRLRDHRRRVLHPLDARSSRPSTPATTSSPTSAAAGSARSIRRAGTRVAASPPASRRPSTSRSPTTAACTTSRAARARDRRRVARSATANGAADHHVAPGEPDRRGRARRPRSACGARGGAAPLPVAAQRRQHRRRDGAGLHASPSASARDNGARFRAVVTQRRSAASTSNAATLTVTANQPPTATITSRPPARSTAAGRRDQLRRHGHRSRGRHAAGESPSPGEVDFHHDTHIHPFIAPTTGVTSGSFTIPTTGETAANVWYRIHLTVRDSAGLTHTTFARRPAAHGADDARHQPGRAAAQARRPAGHGAVLVHRRRRHPAHARGAVAADVRQHHLRVRVLVRRRRGHHNISTPAANTTYTATYRAAGAARAPASRRPTTTTCDFTGTTVTRIDPTVDFDWGRAAGRRHRRRHLQRALDRQVQAAVQRGPTRSTPERRRRPAVGQRPAVVNNWTDHAPTENSGTIALTAGQRYDIRMEYYENSGGATARLSGAAPRRRRPSCRGAPVSIATPPGSPSR